jgi:hypothetical protein
MSGLRSGGRTPGPRRLTTSAAPWVWSQWPWVSQRSGGGSPPSRGSARRAPRPLGGVYEDRLARRRLGQQVGVGLYRAGRQHMDVHAAKRGYSGPTSATAKIPFTFGRAADTDTPFAMPTLKFAVLAGDYIGPEVMSEALRVLEHVARQEGLTLQPEPRTWGVPASTTTARPCLTAPCDLRGATPSSSAPSADRSGRSSRPRSSLSGPRSCPCASTSRSLPTSAPAPLPGARGRLAHQE